MNIAFGPILVVEDVPNVLELLEVTYASRLSGHHRPERSGSHRAGAEGAPRPGHHRYPDAKMDGYALAHRLHHDPQTRQIPLIFLSATYVTRRTSSSP